MSGSEGHHPERRALEMRLSVPAEGSLRAIAGELAARIAEHLGTASPDAQSVAKTVEGLASRLGNGGGHQKHDITFVFRQEAGELVIEARCDGEASEVRHPLPV